MLVKNSNTQGHLAQTISIEHLPFGLVALLCLVPAFSFLLVLLLHHFL